MPEIYFVHLFNLLFLKQLLQEENTELFNLLVLNANNSECQIKVS